MGRLHRLPLVLLTLFFLLYTSQVLAFLQFYDKTRLLIS